MNLFSCAMAQGSWLWEFGILETGCAWCIWKQGEIKIYCVIQHQTTRDCFKLPLSFPLRRVSPAKQCSVLLVRADWVSLRERPLFFFQSIEFQSICICIANIHNLNLSHRAYWLVIDKKLNSVSTQLCAWLWWMGPALSAPLLAGVHKIVFVCCSHFPECNSYFTHQGCMMPPTRTHPLLIRHFLHNLQINRMSAGITAIWATLSFRKYCACKRSHCGPTKWS